MVWAYPIGEYTRDLAAFYRIYSPNAIPIVASMTVRNVVHSPQNKASRLPNVFLLSPEPDLGGCVGHLDQSFLGAFLHLNIRKIITVEKSDIKNHCRMAPPLWVPRLPRQATPVRNANHPAASSVYVLGWGSDATLLHLRGLRKRVEQWQRSPRNQQMVAIMLHRHGVLPGQNVLRNVLPRRWEESVLLPTLQPHQHQTTIRNQGETKAWLNYQPH